MGKSVITQHSSPYSTLSHKPPFQGLLNVISNGLFTFFLCIKLEYFCLLGVLGLWGFSPTSANDLGRRKKCETRRIFSDFAPRLFAGVAALYLTKTIRKLACMRFPDLEAEKTNERCGKETFLGNYLEVFKASRDCVIPPNNFHECVRHT